MTELEVILGELLISRNLTLAIAESCTGGLIANRVTNVSGSSKYFELGVVSYSNDSKIELLNVPLKIIESFGAVSSETAIAMATGVKELAKSNLGLGVTGIAGPTGGTTEKPVGLVFIALTTEETVNSHKFNFSGSRLEIKTQTADAGLKIVIDHLESVNY
jgi:nicotinamide-nucleotide amidase